MIGRGLPVCLYVNEHDIRDCLVYTSEPCCIVPINGMIVCFADLLGCEAVFVREHGCFAHGCIIKHTVQTLHASSKHVCGLMCNSLYMFNAYALLCALHACMLCSER